MLFAPLPLSEEARGVAKMRGAPNEKKRNVAVSGLAIAHG